MQTSTRPKHAHTCPLTSSCVTLSQKTNNKNKPFHHRQPDEEETVKVRNGSYAADSGQSSSPDTASSSSGAGSIADSLDQDCGGAAVVDVADHSSLGAETESGEMEKQKVDDKETTVTAPSTKSGAKMLLHDSKVSAGGERAKSPSSVNSNRLNEDDAQTIKNYQDAAAAEAAINNENNNNNEMKTTTPTSTNEPSSVSGNKQQLQQEQSHDAVDNSTLHGAGQQPVRSPLTATKSNSSNTNASVEALQTNGDEKEQKTTLTQANNNNNYSGLNLNMTASEMRELLSRRKKFDPKKAQMNIRQKYEIIQQM